ncbi:uncharacterized protein PITG_08648 [Phytophthora infestans T30-4]|uniref:Uncharacterized protein n=1 Tax=Phytophthora infestans (strain T30-4) TaxID=403677 RepID=D0NB52_PHYIT|nr:uncharacterized protein PITG_08648 [Phytophthora infestans T30-4]EEY55060.1 conserved hypothetical protein [Phytophthora infestans T30-4]|eukprot:XP_002904005.1 conserved hypothetical protein [Phytophthora infestans T30-4]
MAEDRRTRNVNGQQKITYNALGIEDDDASDEDYVLEAVSEDEEEDENLSSGKSNEGSTAAAAPAFGPAKMINSWEEFEKIFNAYKKKYKLNFRVRSSEKTALYNSARGGAEENGREDAAAEALPKTRAQS